MKIAIASGKGGTGKTMVSTNLAVVLSAFGQNVTYVDCDVEAPNGELFLKPRFYEETSVYKWVPVIDPTLCQQCGVCARFCKFNAIITTPTKTLLFEELCHSCGGCALVCSVDAITEVKRPIGTINIGRSNGIHFVSGVANVGNASSAPIIKATKKVVENADWILFDSPPGTSCSMMETINGSDAVVLVTEPTPFGLHDLRIAMEVVEKAHLPCAVVINRSDDKTEDVKSACKAANVPVIAEIPNDIRFAQAYSRGELAACVFPEMRRILLKMAVNLIEYLSAKTGRYHGLSDQLTLLPEQEQKQMNL